MKYYNMTNSELLNAYNASKEYEPAMCREICTRAGCMRSTIMQTVITSTA